MSHPSSSEQENLPPGVILRDHVYDGIQEYDQRLPNWWLWSFYLAIIFTFIYWLSWFQSAYLTPDAQRVSGLISQIEAARLAEVGELSDETLWQMSRNATVVEQGKTVYQTICVTCHLASLRGKDEGGIGESLVDAKWLYGSNPLAVYEIVMKGSPNKQSGMQAWEAQLGPSKVAQVVAYVLSYHEKN